MSHLHHRVSALIDGELSPAARSRALKHARRCDACRRDIAETLAVKERLSQLAPADVSLDVRVLMCATPVPEQASRAGFVVPAVRRVVVGLGSMSMMVVALAYVVGAPEASQAAAVKPPVNEFAAEFTDSVGSDPLSDPAVSGSGTTVPRTTPVSFGSTSGGPLSANQAPPMPHSLDNPDALLLLQAAVVAPDHVAFRGERLCQTYLGHRTQSFTVDVRHVPGQGTSFRHRGWPPVFVADSVGEDGREDAALERLTASYAINIGGAQRVVGRPATVIEATRDGQLRAKFWIDNTTGLLLRRALYSDGRLVRSSQYESLKTARHGFMPHLPPELPLPPTTELSTRIASALTDKGWMYPSRLGEGFRLVKLREMSTDGGIVGADYSDGLSTLTVFEERGSLDVSSLAGFSTKLLGGSSYWVREGVPTTVVWESGGIVYTVVTDAPDQVAARVVRRLPAVDAAPSRDGVTGRVGHGLARLVSAVKP